MSSTGSSRGLSATTPGLGSGGVSVGSGTASAPGLVGGVSAISASSPAVLWIPPIAGTGLNGAGASPFQNLRVGQQISAQVLVTDAAAGRALLLMDGQRVAAEVPDGLHEGQVVNLSVSTVSAERLVLRLVEGGGSPARTPTAPLDPSAVLRALDLPDTPATRAVVTALVERGQPLTRETIVALRAVVARDSGQELTNARGAVDAMLRGIPVTARSASLARGAGASGAVAAPMGDLFRELIIAIDSAPPGALDNSLDGATDGSRGGSRGSSGSATPGTLPGQVATGTLGGVPGETTRGALMRLLSSMVVQSPTGSELQRVVSVLQGAPEARLARLIAMAVDSSGASEAVAAGAGANGSSAAIATGSVAPATLPAGLPTGDSPAVSLPAPSLSTGATSVVGSGGVQVGSGGSVEGATGSATGVPAIPVPGALPALPIAMMGAIPIGVGTWATAGADARTVLGALLTMLGGSGASSLPTAPGPTSSTMASPPPNPQTLAGQTAGTPDRGGGTPAAMLARVLHDRLEYQQLGNSATLSGTPASTTAGVRPDGTPAAFPTNIPIPAPGDALNFSIPLAFAGQLTTLELAVWRDGGRRQDGQEESSTGLHARMRLDMESLGRVGADIRIIGTSLRCRLTADREDTYALLQQNGDGLLDRLRGAGFSVEGLDYRPLMVAPSDAGRAVVRRVDMGL
ncbi:MAG: flagellar hook-length control protein FliK [Chloroflexi bacterium]|nr:flagellar hook-length control protein FliK [Chloroflexota bacterium]